MSVEARNEYGAATKEFCDLMRPTEKAMEDGVKRATQAGYSDADVYQWLVDHVSLIFVQRRLIKGVELRKKEKAET